MCLTEVKKFKPAKVGYQVKRKGKHGRYQSVYFFIRGGLEIGGTYYAKRETAGGRHDTYLSGFHVFHELNDAKAYQKSSHCWRNGKYHFDSVIIKVKIAGRKTTGLQKFWSRIAEEKGLVGKRVKAKVTVCSIMTVLEEISK